LIAGALLGLLAASGALLAAGRTPWLRRITLDDRLSPYLRDAPRPSRLLLRHEALTPFPTLERLLRPVLGDLMKAIERWIGGVSGVRRRLDQLGTGQTVEQFRAEQVLWGGFGLAAALGFVLLQVASGRVPSPLPVLATTAVLTLGGVLARDRWLTLQVLRREQQMLEEFPTVAELLALAVGAGEGPVAALERVSRLSTGELARELSRALADARAGASLVASLEALAARTTVAPLARFVDGVVIAVERGTPLADVLRAQAVDVREGHKRRLLESAGRKEIGMMLPVVFLVLPITVLFALFPGFYGLDLAA
jgi:tight adherence protein C